MENDRSVYEKKLDSQLKEWSVDIAVLMVKTDSVGDDVKVNYFKAIETLERRQAEVRLKLQESKTAGDRSWIVDLKRGAEKVWSAIQAA